MQSSESSGVLMLIFPSARVVQGWTTACDWLEAPLLGHSPCHRLIESCPQGVLRTIRVVIQPESSGWVRSSAGQKGVDADNLTLHVQCFVHVRTTGVSMRRQGRLYRPMKMKMMTFRYGTLLIVPVMRSTIKFTHIYEAFFGHF